MIRRWYKYGILIFTSLTMLGLITYQMARHIYIASFFNSEEDRLFFSQYLDKTIDFCDMDFEGRSFFYGKPEFSTSGKYLIEVLAENRSYDPTFNILEAESRRKVLWFSEDYARSIIRWAKNETYVVVQINAAMDRNFSTPEIYIGNLTSGLTLHLASGKNNCEDKYINY